MGNIVFTLTALFWAVIIFGGVPYVIIRQRKGAARVEELRQSGALDMSRRARLAVYTSLATIDDCTLGAYPVILGRKPEAIMDAVLLLVEPGEHSFGVTSAQRGDGDALRAELEAGHTYQIGANSEGHYIVPDDADYKYKRVLTSRDSVSAGFMNTIF
ncbi:hypothetical protein FACS1894158_10620 [Betaproteobacteria bacterium]|nr:hypothetical protein FACS1894158_10620 [Betaproteobacteria bacterium]